MGFSLLNHLFLGTPIDGNPHLSWFKTIQPTNYHSWMLLESYWIQVFLWCHRNHTHLVAWIFLHKTCGFQITFFFAQLAILLPKKTSWLVQVSSVNQDQSRLVDWRGHPRKWYPGPRKWWIRLRLWGFLLCKQPRACYSRANIKLFWWLNYGYYGCTFVFSNEWPNGGLFLKKPGDVIEPTKYDDRHGFEVLRAPSFDHHLDTCLLSVHQRRQDCDRWLTQPLWTFVG